MSEPSRPGTPISRLLQWLGKKPSAGRGRPRVRPAGADDRRQREKLRVQVGVIRRAFDDGVAAAAASGSGRAKDDADTSYLFHPDRVLVRADRMQEVEDFFLRRPDQFNGVPTQFESRVNGLAVVRLPKRRDEGDTVLATLDELDAELDRGGMEGAIVSPDHVVYVANRPSLCPATEPEVPKGRRIAAAAWPPPAAAPARIARNKQVRVAVVDTGLWTAATDSEQTPWLRGVLADPSDEEVVDPNKIHPYAGHGTFVAGVVRCLAPTARVEVEGVLTHGGAVYESEIVEQLHEAINDDDHPQIISISAGTHTRGDFASLGFEVLGEQNKLGGRDDILIVAAAGNDASDKPFWPAAFPWVVSVGSVDQTGSVSDFSNIGPWVDVYARGRNLVNAFPKGTYTCYEPPNVGQVRTFDGLAQWSGTSFATPIVTGLIAARMQAERESPGQAWAAVKSGGTSATDPRAGAITQVGPLT